VRLLLAVVGMLVVFYTVPVNADESVGRVAASVLITFVGVAALAWGIFEQVRRQLQSRSEDIHTLVMLLPLAAVLFALAFFVINEHNPSQFDGMSTRTDALYFTLSTLTTVGFGDINAHGQLARVLVMFQLVFNAIFVGAAVSTIVGTIRNRAPLSGQEDAHDSK
jgi:hypothetical protein